MEKSKIKKAGNIVGNIIVYIFLIACILSVVITLFSKRDSDGAAEIFGYQLRIVTSDSMAKSEYTDVSDFDIKSIPIRSMVFVEVIPEDAKEADEWYKSLRVGDVLTFRYVYTTQVTITHRITSITEKETGGFIIQLAGDNKSSDEGQLVQTIDTSISNNTNYVIGKVTGQSRLFGFVMSFLMEPIAMVLIIMVPCVVIILLEIVKILRLLSMDKRMQEQEEKEKKEQELLELRRKLAELEREKSEAIASEHDSNDT